MSSELNRGEYHIEGVDDQSSCNALAILSPVCPVCHEQVSGAFTALGMPYYCVVHIQCMKFFPFDGQWVHPAAFNVMVQRSQSAGANRAQNNPNPTLRRNSTSP